MLEFLRAFIHRHFLKIIEHDSKISFGAICEDLEKWLKSDPQSDFADLQVTQKCFKNEFVDQHVTQR